MSHSFIVAFYVAGVVIKINHYKKLETILEDTSNPFLPKTPFLIELDESHTIKVEK